MFTRGGISTDQVDIRSGAAQLQSIPLKVRQYTEIRHLEMLLVH